MGSDSTGKVIPTWAFGKKKISLLSICCVSSFMLVGLFGTNKLLSHVLTTTSQATLDRSTDQKVVGLETNKDHVSQANTFTQMTTIPSSIDGIRTRAFTPWPSPTFPCHEPDPSHELRSNDIESTESSFLFLKTMKTGSTTASSVQLLIAHNVAKAKLKFFEEKNNLTQPHHGYKDMPDLPMCRMRHRHMTASKGGLAQRRRDKSFAWTILRDPTKQVISRFFYNSVSMQGKLPTDEMFLGFARFPVISMHTIHYLDPNKDHSGQSLKNVRHNVTQQREIGNNIMNSFDFIAVTERMDESMVALQLLLGLQTRDVLRLGDLKMGGSYDGGSSGICKYMVPSSLSPVMKEYFYGENNTEWKSISRVSEALHQAANASLDLTIENLGRERFQEALDKYVDARRHIAEKCPSHELVPCSHTGGTEPRDVCIDRDMGCGFECIDKVADELGLPEYVYVG